VRPTPENRISVEFKKHINSCMIWKLFDFKAFGLKQAIELEKK